MIPNVIGSETPAVVPGTAEPEYLPTGALQRSDGGRCRELLQQLPPLEGRGREVQGILEQPPETLKSANRRQHCLDQADRIYVRRGQPPETQQVLGGDRRGLLRQHDIGGR